jgi:glycosyltransferase involved in cell wall biosynthesis
VSLVETPNRTRVLIIEPAGLLGGSERALLDLVSHIDRRHFDMTVVCPPNSPLGTELDRIGVSKIEAPLQLLHLRGRLARLRAAWSIATIVRSISPHVVHVNQAGVLRVTAAACRLSRTPVICHVRMLQDARQLRDRPSKLLRPARYIAVSEAVLAELGGQQSADAVPMSRIYDPLDECALFENARAVSQPDIRSQFAIPPSASLIALIGRVCADKRQDLLIEAAARLGTPGIYYIIVGDEPSRPSGSPSYVRKLEQDAKELGLDGHVIFAGMRADVPRIIRSCDVIVLASQEEALGRVLLEALALERPIVGPNAGGPGEIIGRDERGLAFEAGSASSFAESIRTSLADSPTGNARTQRGHQWVREQCSPVDHARAVERLYTQTSAAHAKQAQASQVS